MSQNDQGLTIHVSNSPSGRYKNMRIIQGPTVIEYRLLGPEGRMELAATLREAAAVIDILEDGA